MRPLGKRVLGKRALDLDPDEGRLDLALYILMLLELLNLLNNNHEHPIYTGMYTLALARWG